MLDLVPKNGDDEHSQEYWGNHINASLHRTVEGIIETGKRLTAAKAALRHGEFEAMVKRFLPIDIRMAQIFMKIADHPIISNTKYVSLLPPVIGTLYDLTTVPNETLRDQLDRSMINPKFKRDDVARLRRLREAKNPGAKHKVKMTPILKLKEEKEELEREKADLEEELAAAQTKTDIQVVVAEDASVEVIVNMMINRFGEDKTKEIGLAIMDRWFEKTKQAKVARKPKKKEADG
jgi:hypothetical protein